MPQIKKEEYYYARAGEKFKKGDPRSGRKMGSRNKFTTLKYAFLQAFEYIGGVEALATWAQNEKNRGDFYKIITQSEKQ